ncbi:hypothetical protein GW17_00046335 [Ensete ventricosum]|nr:hypothetical protein GW17_00046335 [Ensete ventricosum]RZS14211.1 hypothetical protein BHM03_00045878 [Ensete ventricosum]
MENTGYDRAHSPPERASPPIRIIREPLARPWRRPQRPPPRVYHVEPRDFRWLVHRLTGVPPPSPPAPLPPPPMVADSAAPANQITVPGSIPGSPSPSQHPTHASLSSSYIWDPRMMN